MVFDGHNDKFQADRRTVGILKRNFATLHRKKIIKYDLLCPSDVKRAKHIRFNISRKIYLGDGVDGEEIVENNMGSSFYDSYAGGYDGTFNPLYLVASLELQYEGSSPTSVTPLENSVWELPDMNGNTSSSPFWLLLIYRQACRYL